MLGHTCEARARRASALGQYPQSYTAARAAIPDEIAKYLPGAILGQLVDVLSAHYHDGRISTGAEMVDTNAVWIEAHRKIYDLPVNVNEALK